MSIGAARSTFRQREYQRSAGQHRAENDGVIQKGEYQYLNERPRE